MGRSVSSQISSGRKWTSIKFGNGTQAVEWISIKFRNGAQAVKRISILLLMFRYDNWFTWNQKLIFFLKISLRKVLSQSNDVTESQIRCSEICIDYSKLRHTFPVFFNFIEEWITYKSISHGVKSNVVNTKTSWQKVEKIRQAIWHCFSLLSKVMRTDSCMCEISVCHAGENGDDVLS
jgi:hypothetical protein